MITIDKFLKELKDTRDKMFSELAVLNGKRDQLLNDINKLNSLISEIENTEE